MRPGGDAERGEKDAPLSKRVRCNKEGEGIYSPEEHPDSGGVSRVRGENSFNPGCLEPNSLNAFLEELLLAEQTTLPVAKKVGMVNRGVNPF